MYTVYILYIQQIYTVQVRMTTNDIVIHLCKMRLSIAEPPGNALF
jgi:hypothetical protein